MILEELRLYTSHLGGQWAIYTETLGTGANGEPPFLHPAGRGHLEKAVLSHFRPRT